MPRKILTERHEELLVEERRRLAELQRILAGIEASREDQELLERSVGQLDELFLLVVAGEFNSGKSTFINALLGTKLLEEGVTPTTTRIHTLTYGGQLRSDIGEDGIEHLEAPVDLLREVHIVDTPGTNALIREHEAITQRYVPRSDLVLFVTSADRTFTESERAFIEQIRGWGKKLVFVINKTDILRSPGEVAEIERFVVENAVRLLGFSPEVFSVSSRLALEAKLAAASDGDVAAALMEKSRFPAFERYLVDALDERERIRLKLLNPLGVGRNLARKYAQAAEGRLHILQDDFAALDNIERQLELYQEDLRREFRFRLTDVDNVLRRFEQRGQEFMDETIRLGRVFDLINKNRIKEQFEKQVVADSPREIERRVAEIIDWMVSAELRQWQALNEHLVERRAQHAERVVGKIGTFDYDRRQLLDTVGRAAQRTIDNYDPEAEADRLAQSVKNSVAGLAVLEVGAIGLGTIITLLATTALVDVTGILAASLVAAVGLFVLPARRRAAKQELSEKISELRSRLMDTLTDQFEQETERSLFRIRDALAPYTRFVRAERERLEEMHSQLEEVTQGLDNLQRRVEQI